MDFPLVDNFESYTTGDDFDTIDSGYNGAAKISTANPCTGTKSAHINDRWPTMEKGIGYWATANAATGIQYLQIRPAQTGFTTAGNLCLTMSAQDGDYVALILYFIDNGTDVDVRFGDYDGPYTEDPITTIPRNSYTKVGIQWDGTTGQLRLSFDGGTNWGDWFDGFDGAENITGIWGINIEGWTELLHTASNEYYIDDLSAGGGSETTAYSTMAGLCDAQKELKNTLAGNIRLETHYDSEDDCLAGESALEKVVEKTVAGLSILEKEEIISLAGIAEAQYELKDTLSGKVDAEKEKEATLGGIADCYSSNLSDLAGLAELEARKESTLAGKADLEENSGDTVAGLCVLEERTEKTIAGKVELEEGYNSTLACFADCRFPFTIVQFNGLDINNAVEITERASHDNAPSRIVATYKIARRDGEKLVSSFFAKKEIDVSGFIQSTTRAGLETLIDSFKAQLQAVGYLDIEYSTGIRRYYAVFSELIIQRDSDHLDWCPFSIKFVVPSGKGQDVAKITTTENGITTNTHPAYFINVGSAEANPKFTITVNSATAINIFQITAGGKAITINKTINNGDVIVVDFDTYDVTINGSPADYTGTWPKFPTGSVWYSIALDGTGSSRNYNLVIDYYPQYL
jgi:phage-related protein